MIVKVTYQTFFGQADAVAIGKFVCMTAQHLTIQQGDKKSHIPTCKIKTVYPKEENNV